MDLTMNELRILSTLLDKDRYGLEIIKTVEESGGKIFLGGLYNIMKRLEKKGLVESYYEDTSEGRGGNRRKYFKINGKGQEAVQEAQLSLTSLWNLRLA